MWVNVTKISSKREVDRLHSRFTKLAIDIFTEKPRLVDRSERVLEGIKGEIVSLIIVLEKLYLKQPEEKTILRNVCNCANLMLPT